MTSVCVWDDNDAEAGAQSALLYISVYVVFSPITSLMTFSGAGFALPILGFIRLAVFNGQPGVISARGSL